jgi:hypothetical protein
MCRYTMNMTSKDTGKVSEYSYDLLPSQNATESVGYFVLEHQPKSCTQLPSNGKVVWRNITVHVNGAKVDSPSWVAKEEEPTCQSKAVVVDSETIEITWETS